ncbi:MAG: hypothetical protein HYX61_03115 [Gammaproteobacteria bacterium]|nr:hypothetical protein [Gammaproteobacteria bacterium]
MGKSKKKNNESKHSVGFAVHARQLKENAKRLNEQEHQRRSKPVAHVHSRTKISLNMPVLLKKTSIKLIKKNL